ncbi:hypothetical protein PX52LOC_07280 [Limnoglobus roseus]|uniref:Uncharacterized protein n=1 Tax=Limnoglobus roseus TaxID=2598579 RepID=A0A5C1AR30_9BACT|nr:hypothetical protein PX52LOC_07280 [Limnoglobus roseus]
MADDPKPAQLLRNHHVVVINSSPPLRFVCSGHFGFVGYRVRVRLSRRLTHNSAARSPIDKD